MAERLFHCVVAREWRASAAGTPWVPATLANEGFVHLSFLHQLEGTLGLHFSAQDELYLLELDAERVAADLRIEPSRAGERFPHLYRALEESDVIAWWALAAGGTGRPPEDLGRGATPGAPPRG